MNPLQQEEILSLLFTRAPHQANFEGLIERMVVLLEESFAEIMVITNYGQGQVPHEATLHCCKKNKLEDESLFEQQFLLSYNRNRGPLNIWYGDQREKNYLDIFRWQIVVLSRWVSKVPKKVRR